MHLPAALWGYKLLSMPLIIYPHIVAPAIYIYTTHQKSICPAQDMYSDDRRVWNRIFQMVSEDLAVCEAGLQIGGEVIFPIILGNKGDWSYLVSWWFEV